jgi:transposase
VGDEGIAADRHSPARVEVDLGVRGCRTGDRLVDGRFPYGQVNTETTQAFRGGAAKRLRLRERAVMIRDRAGWHCSHNLRWPRRITPLFLPPYSPELNSVERMWYRFREHHWSSRTYADEQALVVEAIRIHRTLRRKDISSMAA